ncbi:signal peptidase II [Tersicoccus sp. MR15.9]|uniref:signal peptidase II n=1 Tax=Tersicoccus mangrovi TaxID=3121635 RepID=UPI002FE6B46C
MNDGDDARTTAPAPEAATPPVTSVADAPGEPGDTATRSSAAPLRRRRAGYVVLLLACAAFAWVLDQSTKLWVLSTMTEGQVTPVLPPLLRWHFIRNSGAAFSFGEGHTWVFTLIMVAVALFVLTVLVRRVASWWWAIALGLLLGGTLGNLTDRLFRDPGFGVGHVIDFIALPNFAIFNMADSAIVGGVITLCVLTLLSIGISGQRETAREKRTDLDTDATAADTTAEDGPGRLR